MSSQSSVGHESDLKGDKCCFLVEELNQYVEGQLSSSLRSSVEGVMPPLQVIVCSDSFHIHTPSCWWEGTADNPVVIGVLAKCFQGLCCRSLLEVTETSFYFFLLAGTVKPSFFSRTRTCRGLCCMPPEGQALVPRRK